MAKQTRNIYVTGNPIVDRILTDIAARLDVIEGLRPDLDAGYYSIDADKDLDTESPISGHQLIADGVSIAANTIILTESTFEIVDENGTTIHKME